VCVVISQQWYQSHAIFGSVLVLVIIHVMCNVCFTAFQLACLLMFCEKDPPKVFETDVKGAKYMYEIHMKSI
jgi:hypothetical protein